MIFLSWIFHSSSQRLSQTLWFLRILMDLSDLRDAGIISDSYLEESIKTLTKVLLIQDPEFQKMSEVEQKRIFDQISSPAESKIFEGNESGKLNVSRNRKRQPKDMIHLIPGEKIAGRKWEFHLTDADPTPPPPHGHDVEDHSVCLDPYTGNIYKKGQYLSRATEKELHDVLWSKPKFRDFANRARDHLKNTQSHRVSELPQVPELRKTKKRSM